ncbi:MAG: glycoside hydrolase family 43 protein [Lachnospiraceae bacterium]|nr:glycoside hydrolase family 43 protein [Lachnospiraceae bacterium]
MYRKIRAILALMMAVMLLMGCGNNAGKPTEVPGGKTTPGVSEEPAPTDPCVPETPTPTAGGQENAEKYITKHSRVSVHDPSIEYDNGKYYIFGSHLAAAVSEDLASWSYIQNSNKGYSRNNKLFNTYDKVFAEPGKYVGGTDQLWAPDVIYNKAMGKYCMYMSVSGTTTTSCIALAVADSIEGPYEYVDTVIYSGFTDETVGMTDVLKVLGIKSLSETKYNYDGKSSNADYPNCIDPTVFYGGDGKLYMVYGSMSGGIFMVLLDEKTGRLDRTYKYTDPKDDPYFGVRIAAGQRKTGEGSFIMYDDESGYYYLFVTYGYLNAHCGYQIREFRSKEVFGPYLDAAGRAATVEPGGTNVDKGIKLFGDYDFSCLTNAYTSPGHNSAIKTPEGEYFLVYHQRFNNKGEMHEVRVHKLVKNSEDWLTALPYEYSGEKDLTETPDPSEVAGVYEFIAHGTEVDVSSTPIIRSTPLAFCEDGTVLDNCDSRFFGSWSFMGDGGKVRIQTPKGVYYGVFSKQMTEGTKRETYVFSAISKRNDVIWGSRLEEFSDEVSVERDSKVATTYLIPSETKESLKLPLLGDFYSQYIWSSSDTSVIANDGTLYRPLQDTTVEISVTVQHGDVSKTVSKKVKVLGGLEPNSAREDGIVAIYSFNPGEELKDSSGNGYDLTNFGVTFENGVAVFDGKSYLQFPAAVTKAEIQSVIIKFSVDDTAAENPFLTISDSSSVYFRFYVDTEGRVVADAKAAHVNGTQKSFAISGTGEWQRFGFNNGGTDSIDNYKGGSIAALNGDRAWRGETFKGFIGFDIGGLCNYIGRDAAGKAFMRGKIEEIIFYNTYIGETGLKTCFEGQ